MSSEAMSSEDRTLLADRYRLEERLAVGGMGEVWRATDTVLMRTVAVKTLRPELVTDPDTRARFRAEARHAAGLSHPGIASVFDFGERPEGAWLVMELVEGEALSAVLQREGALPADRVLDLMAQTATALAAAHDGGVVHRDIKPGNLMVRPDGVVKVTDFGIAFAADAAPLTRTGLVVGTAFYLSPEQAGGKTAVPASDLYALGVVAYECLAGQRPFLGENPIAVARAHFQDPAPDLPTTVPPAVALLVGQLLDKDPSRRPASAQLLADEATALRTQLSGDATTVLPRVTPVRAATDAPRTSVLPTVVAGPSLPLSRTATRPPLRTDAAADQARPGATPRSQRRAVTGIGAVLALLVAAVGLRTAFADPGTLVPDLAAGVAVTEAVAALQDAELRPEREDQASADVPAGDVIALQPTSGTDVDTGSVVTVLVSTGPAPVTVVAADLVGRPAAEVSDLLAGLGLVPRLAYDGSGQAIGTVSGVEPVGEVAVGSTIVVQVVPTPAASPSPSADEDKAQGKGRGKDEDDD